MAKILIVDDEEAINKLVKNNLSLIGHECDQAYDGKEALEKIIDLFLKTKSNSEFIQIVKKIKLV